MKKTALHRCFFPSHSLFLQGSMHPQKKGLICDIFFNLIASLFILETLQSLAAMKIHIQNDKCNARVLRGRCLSVYEGLAKHPKRR